MTLLAIYHPPSQTNHSTHPVFLDEFADYMENFLTTNYNIVIAGDFNLHIDNEIDPEAHLFTDMMAALGLDCHADFHTYESGHSVDLVFTEKLGEVKIIRCNPSTYLSGHCTIECLLSLKKCNMQKRDQVQEKVD